MKKICFLLTFFPNPRIRKRINLFKEKYKISVIYVSHEDAGLYAGSLKDIPVKSIKAKYGMRGKKQRIFSTLNFIPKFMHELENEHPHCLYVQNIDMLFIACQYKKHDAKVKIVCEIADLHPLIIDKQTGIFGIILQKLLHWLDRKYSRETDLYVLTSIKFYNDYYEKFLPRKKILYMPNIPDFTVFNGFVKKKHENFTIGYIGLIRFKQQMKLLIDAASELGINVFFAGTEQYEPENGIILEEYIKGFPNVSFLGRYNYETEIKNLYAKADAIYAVYDTTQKDIRLALPNKLYEAIYCERPIIVAKGTYLAKVVKDWGVGIEVSDIDGQEVKDALMQMTSNSEKYDAMVYACKRKKIDMKLSIYNQDLQKRMDDIFR